MMSDSTQDSESIIRVGAIDCGTNSIRLLVADIDLGTGRLTDVSRRMEIVRLGQDVDRTGVIAADAMERTLAKTRTPYLVIDLGGGSTEFVRGTTSVEAARSIDIGCVRMTERHLQDDPPTAQQIAAATADIDAAIDLAAAAVPLEGIVTLVGLAGSVTTITAHSLGLRSYDPVAIHLSRLPVQDVLAAADALLHMSRAERGTLPYMHPGRVDVMGAGALVWGRVIERVAAVAGITEVVTSEHDILDGIARSLVR